MPEIHAAESPDPFAAFQPGWARTYYVDYYVRADDAASLRSGEWLRDPILAFWGAHLQAQAGEGVAVLAPSIVSLLRLLSTPAEARELVRPLRLGERECVVCFVNNSETRSGQSSSGGHGTHWSLLVYDRCRREFTALDSMGRHNEKATRELATRLSGVLCSPAESASALRWASCPQQSGPCDCGVHCCINAQRVVAQYCKARCSAPLPRAPESPGEWRKVVARLLLELPD
eukprot:TRINITY_DN2267_c0_g1_i1.p1 TRINITY_DN2267_c0_g1~~TRINITY_DN2267_c0_g1_i1.p1  ORF type:complete len:231 (+),score=45.28 TRINITY_DN2267_c0_g1_i1:75-767(+)